MPGKLSTRVLEHLMHSVPTVAPVPHRSVLSLSGSQASEFLNGILASSVNQTGPHRPMYSTFLHAQGRVLYDVFIYTHTTPEGKPAYLIDYDSRASADGVTPPLLFMLKRYVLRSKVKLRDVSEEYDVWSAWGSDYKGAIAAARGRKWTHANSGAVEPDWSAEAEWPWGTEERAVRDRRAEGMGLRMLVQKGEKPKQSSSHDLALSESYTLNRILHAVPEGVEDIPPMKAFPMESNLDMMGGLDFRKGCYVGQELTVRTYHTGTIRKRIYPVVIQQSEDSSQSILRELPPLPTSIDLRASATTEASTTRPRKVGKLLSSTQGVGLAMLRLDDHLGCAINGDPGHTYDLDLAGQVDGAAPGHWKVTPWRPETWPLFRAQF
ncbi:hypothetical protein HWV62_3082 [Athelia sp. TMB]|nr:hypothetical protein HWV62_3082 [Athelia sp. TMB]